MGKILLSIKNEKSYLEALLYVFHNQISLGYKFLQLTIKYKDGERTYIKGNIDSIFRSETITNLDYGDLILLEHSNVLSQVSPHTYYTGFITSDDDLIALSQKWSEGCYFIIQERNLSTYYIINNYPMLKYSVKNNDVISEMILGKYATGLNNICGKIHNYNGLISKKLLR